MVNGISIARLYYVLPSSQICVMTVTELWSNPSVGTIPICYGDVQELENEEGIGKGKPA